MRLDDDLDAGRYRYLVEHHSREICALLNGGRDWRVVTPKGRLDEMIDNRRALQVEPAATPPGYGVTEHD